MSDIMFVFLKKHLLDELLFEYQTQAWSPKERHFLLKWVIMMADVAAAPRQ